MNTAKRWGVVPDTLTGDALKRADRHAEALDDARSDARIALGELTAAFRAGDLAAAAAAADRAHRAFGLISAFTRLLARDI